MWRPFIFTSLGVVGASQNEATGSAVPRIKVKFCIEPPWDEGTNICSNGPGLMNKMATMPYMLKTLKHLLRNQKAYDLETWYAALGARVLPSLFK